MGLNSHLAVSCGIWPPYGQKKYSHLTTNNPRGTADTERGVRSIKEQIVWINEFSNSREGFESLGNWIVFGSGVSKPRRILAIIGQGTLA